MTDTLKYNQSIFDFCIWKYGDISFFAKLRRDNNINLSETTVNGTELTFDNNLGRNDVKDFFKLRNYIPSNVNANANISINAIFEDGNLYLYEDNKNLKYDE